MSDDTSFPAPDQSNIIDLAASIVSAYVSNNRVPTAELPALLSTIHAAVAGLSDPSSLTEAEVDKPTPAQIRKSIRPEGLVSFIDGKPYKTLKRHLTGNGMTFDEYRTRYGLPHNYPSVAASYSETRSALAKSLGLGQQRKNSAKAAERTEAVSDKPKRAAGRPRKAEKASEV